jgi:CRP/FNR family cyclic AMP-dependent transcriptional regulator
VTRYEHVAVRVRPPAWRTLRPTDGVKEITGVLLDGLSPQEQAEVRSRCRRQRFAAGEHLFHTGDIGDALHYIDRGRVLILVATSGGDTVALTVYGQGQSFGEQALLDPRARRTATARALEPTETLALARADFEAMRSLHPHLERVLSNVLADQVRRLTERLVEALTEPVEVRVYRRLHELGAVYAVTGTQEPIPLTQDQVAAMAGARLRITNRVLNDARRDGVVSTHRRRIVVHDWDALRRRAQLPR